MWTIFWDYLWMSLWCIGSFFFVISYFVLHGQDHLIYPYLLFGYFVAVWPSTYNASMGYFFKLVSVFLGTIAMVMSIIFFNKFSFEVLVVAFISVMIIGLMFQLRLFNSLVKSNIKSAEKMIDEDGLDIDEVIKLAGW